MQLVNLQPTFTIRGFHTLSSASHHNHRFSYRGTFKPWFRHKDAITIRLIHRLGIYCIVTGMQSLRMILWICYYDIYCFMNIKKFEFVNFGKLDLEMDGCQLRTRSD